MRISMANKAQENLEEIFKFSSNISINYANKTIENIYLTIDSIKDYPYIGRYVLELSNKHYRERIYKNFRIIYYVSEKRKTIYILYIFSNKQNLNLFFTIHKKDFIKFLNQNFI